MCTCVHIVGTCVFTRNSVRVLCSEENFQDSGDFYLIVTSQINRIDRKIIFAVVKKNNFISMIIITIIVTSGSSLFIYIFLIFSNCAHFFHTLHSMYFNLSRDPVSYDDLIMYHYTYKHIHQELAMN